MLEEILNGMSTDAQAIYQKVHCLAEITINGKGQKQPKVYDKSGQLLNASDFDNFDGLGYFRHDGDMNIRQDAIIEKTTSCGEPLIIEYPMKFVGGIAKNKIGDNAFSDDNVVLKLIKKLQKTSVFNQTIAYQVIVNRSSVDSLKIIQEEYQGFEFKDFNYNLSYVALYFTLRIGADKSCLPDC